ncbi:lipid IV(A) 3-deoxy-D-manno-octulosonic acid transferase [Hydrocarboniphaga sp.]|uniref:lipid IV(A) 3-deoxy-D-manno-octulosonic acid transferase n=1 Tax=Hydrocarboniphaga sp. TaxID=2033016 RepID=UPI00260880F1|nr:lipid IV(A) 3-deoxy-D-manno-octulosonic acid transferase [Hydrocarboniphaga sp.]
MRLLYTALLYLITPLVLLRLLWRSRDLADYRRRWNERFGFVAPADEGVAVWVHAVSVGESLAALPLIRELIARHGERSVWVTTTTPTGSARVIAALGERVRHSYAPYDLPGAVSRFLRRTAPRQVVVMETELWPNLFHQLGKLGIPLIVANARLSPRSMRGYSKVRGFAAATLAHCRVAAQSPEDAERFKALGAQRVSVMGNIKFDQAVPDAQLAAGSELRRRIGPRAVWIAASTHEGEEEALLKAHVELRRHQSDALLILVPRHPQRFDAAARSIERASLSYVRRSSNADPANAAVLLGDSMGEIFLYYAASDVAFVGGSLMPIGGHNVLEPAAIGLPVVFGPHMHNFLPARDLLIERDAAIQVEAETALAPTIHRLLGDTALRTRMGEAGRAAISANRGALQRLLQLLA